MLLRIGLGNSRCEEHSTEIFFVASATPYQTRYVVVPVALCAKLQSGSVVPEYCHDRTAKIGSS